MSFPNRALAAVDGLHRVLQAWFNAEGGQDPARVLAHFDPAYVMVTTAGAVLDLAGLAAALPRFWGSRPGLVMAISEERLVQAGPGFALLTYRERQTLGDAVTDRLSTVLMLDAGEGAPPAWRHLQETLVA